VGTGSRAGRIGVRDGIHAPSVAPFGTYSEFSYTRNFSLYLSIGTPTRGGPLQRPGISHRVAGRVVDRRSANWRSVRHKWVGEGLATDVTMREDARPAR
jgi:hypothetical protein